jgi:hypothetical protein
VSQLAASGNLPVIEPEREMAMDIYNLTKVASMTSHPPLNEITYAFNITGEHRRPLVAFSYERREEADTAYKLIAEAIAKAKLITPMVSASRPTPRPPTAAR